MKIPFPDQLTKGHRHCLMIAIRLALFRRFAQCGLAAAGTITIAAEQKPDGGHWLTIRAELRGPSRPRLSES